MKAAGSKSPWEFDSLIFRVAIYDPPVSGNYGTYTTNYLTVEGQGSLKKRVTTRKFDKDGKVVEEIVTEEYGNKEVTTIPYYDPSPWYAPSPYVPNYITCNTFDSK